jgi:hypothetical protein
LDGNPRIAATTVDMGAYEFTAPTLAHNTTTAMSGGSPVDLATATGPSPTGGTFSGSHVTKGSFDPTGLTPGTQVTVTYTDPSGYTATVTVTVTEAPSLVVTTANDVVNNTDGLNSLREALAYAATLTGPQTITFSNSTAGGAVNFFDGTAHTITLLTALPELSTFINIAGPGAKNLTVQRSAGAADFSVFSVTSTVSLSGLTISGGKAVNGGGIQAGPAGNPNLTVTDCAIVGNTTSGVGGGIAYYNYSVGVGSNLRVMNCTISGNSAGQGGGIYVAMPLLGTSGAVISNTTISGNTASQAGGGFYG